MAWGRAASSDYSFSWNIKDALSQDGEGITPLHLACIQNRQNLAMILMNRWNDYQHRAPNHHPCVCQEDDDLYDDLMPGAVMEAWWTRVGDLRCTMPSRKGWLELFRCDEKYFDGKNMLFACRHFWRAGKPTSRGRTEMVKRWAHNEHGCDAHHHH